MASTINSADSSFCYLISSVVRATQILIITSFNMCWTQDYTSKGLCHQTSSLYFRYIPIRPLTSHVLQRLQKFLFNQTAEFLEWSIEPSQGRCLQFSISSSRRSPTRTLGFLCVVEVIQGFIASSGRTTWIYVQHSAKRPYNLLSSPILALESELNHNLPTV
jgi:hypothetical protein